MLYNPSWLTWSVRIMVFMFTEILKDDNQEDDVFL